MKLVSRAVLLSSVLAVSLAGPASAADPGVTFVGRGFVPGNLLDLSGLGGQPICQLDDPGNCIDQATLGGFGSAMAYSGFDNVFLAASDRGPFDGRTDVPYKDRIHYLHIDVTLGASFPNIQTTLLDSRFLKNEAGQNLLGSSSAFVQGDDPATLRFDPEGIRVSHEGTFFVTDEYGPYLFEFDRQGHLLRRVAVPARFLIANPSGDVDEFGNSLELYPAYNTSGRQANRGMEGLAITPDGRVLIGIMQNALIQDHGLNSATPPGRVGVNNRIFTYDLVTGESHEYVYSVDAINQGKGVNELVAINGHELLVLERDNRSKVPTPPNTAQTPNLKRVYRIDLAQPGLTDVSAVESLPETAAELAALSIVPVTKTLFLDLLSPDYVVGGGLTIKDVIAEKVEALTWGPSLPDGRVLFYVMTDNDLFTGLPTQIYAFAVDAAAAGFQYQAQELPGPMFPPGQVKKILGQ
jgi:Esterase-like activity of phytase